MLNKFIKPLFSPFSKNKWHSRNPAVRKKAVQDLPVSDQETLSKIAMNDSDENIRAIAANKLSDLDLLQTIIMKGTNGTVKDAAQNRLLQLICGLKHPVPEFSVREKMIRGSRNSALLEYVAANADEASLREITIKKISRDPLLGDIALLDNSPHIRQLAAQQIAKRSTLERVTKKSRRKDKRVYKIVKNKLDHIIEDEQRPALLAKEVVDICDKLEKLHKRNRLVQEKTTFENFVSRWEEIRNFANADITQRYQTIYSSIISSLDKIDTDLKKEKDVIQNLEFQSILDLADTKSMSDFAINKETTQSDSYRIIQSLTEQAKTMLEKPGFIPEKTIAALQNKFQQQIASCQQADEINLFQQKFESAIKTLKEKLALQQENTQKFKQQILTHSDTIKKLISNGHVSKAEKYLKEQLKEIEQSSLLSSIEKQNHQNELHKIHSQLDDLSSWRNWAHDNERENLALKAEKLVQQISASQDPEKEYADITAQVKELRKQWKSMRSHTQEDLWQHFNTACNLVYEQCQPFIDKQNQIRRDNLIAKQNLCEQLENYIQNMGWPSSDGDSLNHSLDWIQVDKITRQARKEWGTIGFVERKHHKSINRRFDKSIEIIRDELKKIWESNHEKFFNLIQKVEALHDSIDDDLSGAINKAKDHQKQWQLIGSVSSYQRNKLWKRFRKGCDLIFNKRQENIEQKNSLNVEHLREKEAICENLEALNKQPLDEKDLQNAFSDIEDLWLELKPLAKSLSKEVNQRYKVATDIYQQKINDLAIEQQKQLLAQIIKQADLCTQIESSTDSSEQIIAQFNAQWQTLNQHSSSESQLLKRYKNALESITVDKSSLLQTELENKQQFCLKYEILLGKNTPDEDQQSRMKMQVELLNSNLGSNHVKNSDNSEISAFELQLKWYQMSNYSHNQQLEQRFLHLLTD